MARPNTQPAKRRPTQRDFAAATNDVADRMETLATKLARGRVNLEGWADEFYRILVDGHTEAYALGRQRAGDLTGVTTDDRLLGRGLADQQEDYFHAFLEQLDAKDPRYFDADGNLRPGPFLTRCRMYASRMRGSASEAFVDASEPDDEFDWVLGPTEHCPDCLELHQLGPYTPSTIISHPGDGQTECKVNCHCHLVRKRGNLDGFQRVDLFGLGEDYQLPELQPSRAPADDSPSEPVLIGHPAGPAIPSPHRIPPQGG